MCLQWGDAAAWMVRRDQHQECCRPLPEGPRGGNPSCLIQCWLWAGAPPARIAPAIFEQIHKQVQKGIGYAMLDKLLLLGKEQPKDTRKKTTVAIHHHNA